MSAVAIAGNRIFLINQSNFSNLAGQPGLKCIISPFAWQITPDHQSPAGVLCSFEPSIIEGVLI
jgi:hypothetical protein